MRSLSADRSAATICTTLIGCAPEGKGDSAKLLAEAAESAEQAVREIETARMRLQRD